MTKDKRALVLGATGGIGGETARCLLARGWRVTALHRDPPAAGRDGFDWRRGDALRPEEVARAAEGVSLILHAVNPPGYRNWAELVLPMLESSIAAARVSGARVLLPGTLYNYGPDAFPLVAEEAPQNPRTRKGAIRVAMERRLEAAAKEGVRSLILRAGDFFGSQAGNNWFSQGLVKPGRPLAAISDPGTPGVGHLWAYLPDLGETFARLAEREAELPPFARFHFQGHWDADGTAMVAAIRRAGAGPGPERRRFPWGLVTLASPVVPLFHELREMRYLWQVPVRLDNRRLLELLGEEPHTPLDEAVHRTLAGLGCLPAQA